MLRLMIQLMAGRGVTGEWRGARGIRSFALVLPTAKEVNILVAELLAQCIIETRRKIDP